MGVHSAGVTDSNLSLVVAGSSFGYTATICLLQLLSLEVTRRRTVRSGGETCNYAGFESVAFAGLEV